MSGRKQPFYGKRRPQTKAPGAKPNARRQRQLAVRRRKRRENAIFQRQAEQKQSAE